MASTSIDMIPPTWEYDVFLSFRGEDIRNTFIDHLYKTLIDKGIHTFKDDKRIEKGKSIGPELRQAIEGSMFSVIIFSPNYAESTWCLDEVVMIWECMKVKQQRVLPVFHDVEPSVVRKQNGSFEKYFVEHENKFTNDVGKVKKWRQALREIANLSGWHLERRPKRNEEEDNDTRIHDFIMPESEVIQAIYTIVSSSSLKHTLLSAKEDLVGINARMEKLSSDIDLGLDDVRMIGIRGMAGIGKTTISKVVYDQISKQFQGCSFLGNVREVSKRDGLVSLQKKLLREILSEENINIQDKDHGINVIRSRLRCKKVLIIIDDVDENEQLQSLCGKDWFGSGSRIIITTTNEHLLLGHDVDKVHELKELSNQDALTLFSRKAFKKNHPTENFLNLSYQFVKYASNLPLAIDVLGSFLYKRSIDEWTSALNRLKKYPDDKIMNVLRISFDGLKEVEKKIFLDIACFFKGDEVDNVRYIMDSCGFDAHIGISVLIQKSLVTVIYNRLMMHDLLQEMGWNIVREESPDEPGKRSRLFRENDVYHVLKKNTGTEKVEGISLKLPTFDGARYSAKAFSKMNRVRLLKIKDLHFSDRLEGLSNELRLLDWQGYPFESLPTGFQPDELVEISMPHSHIVQLWKNMMPLVMLTIMDLSHSQSLIKTPHFSCVPNLERLILEGCTILYEVNSSLGSLKRLVFLNLRDCKSLVNLPTSICELRSLKNVDLSGCSNLESLPENFGFLEGLEELNVNYTAITQPPSSIVNLRNLIRLSFRGCKASPRWYSSLFERIWSISNGLLLPSSISGMVSLTNLDLSDCNLSEGILPADLGLLCSLVELNLSKNNFITIPSSINRLSKLVSLNLNKCESLQSWPELPTNLETISAQQCTSLTTFSDPYNLHKDDSSSIYYEIAFTSLKNYLKGPCREDGLDIVIPGSKIHEWFNNQRNGYDVNVPLIPTRMSSTKWVGYALCAVFVVYEDLECPYYPKHILGVDLKASYDEDFCYYENARGFGPALYVEEAFGQFDKINCNISDHLWLNYQNCDGCLFDSKGWKDDFKFLKFSFGTSNTCRCLEVKKCGVRLVYKLDSEEFEQTIIQCGSSSSSNSPSEAQIAESSSMFYFQTQQRAQHGSY